MPTTTTTTRKLSPKDFDAYRAQIRDCHCPLCRQLGVYGRSPAQCHADAVKLLEALEAGTHTRMELAEYVAQAKRAHAAKVAQACADGVTDYRMWYMTLPAYNGREWERYYGLGSLAFRAGSGLGMGRDLESERQWRSIDAQVASRDKQLADAVPGLVAKDPRNACVCFRQTGALCDHHAPLFPSE